MKKLIKSKNCNVNYLAKIVQLDNLRKHNNADKLQIANIDFQDTVVDMNYNNGDVCIFFPIECVIGSPLLSHLNAYRESTLNKDKSITGFFDDKGRVRAVKLRGEKSCGFLVKIEQVIETYGEFKYDIGEEFDYIGDDLICKKYELPVKSINRARDGKKPRASMVVDGQVHLHVDTENLKRNIDKINPSDLISITYKIHGTSFWVSNVIGKRKLNFAEKFLKNVGVKIQDTENRIFFGSRKVIKNQYETQHVNDFYDGDLYNTIKEEIKDKIPAGYTIYGECAGKTPTGKEIQKGYDYGCVGGEHKLFVYRITITNKDGVVFNLSSTETQEFCYRVGLDYVPMFYNGLAMDLFNFDTEEDWNKKFIELLEEKYTNKECYICQNSVPEEGIVLRVENQFEFKSYKLKSFSFLEYETKLLDSGEVDMESEN